MPWLSCQQTHAAGPYPPLGDCALRAKDDSALLEYVQKVVGKSLSDILDAIPVGSRFCILAHHILLASFLLHTSAQHRRGAHASLLGTLTSSKRAPRVTPLAVPDGGGARADEPGAAEHGAE